jgi:hypothetical protein
MRSPSAITFTAACAFRVLDLGRGESDAEAVWILDDRAAFVGDLVEP